MAHGNGETKDILKRSGMGRSDSIKSRAFHDGQVTGRSCPKKKGSIQGVKRSLPRRRFPDGQGSFFLLLENQGNRWPAKQEKFLQRVQAAAGAVLQLGGKEHLEEKQSTGKDTGPSGEDKESPEKSLFLPAGPDRKPRKKKGRGEARGQELLRRALQCFRWERKGREVLIPAEKAGSGEQKRFYNGRPLCKNICLFF